MTKRWGWMVLLCVLLSVAAGAYTPGPTLIRACPGCKTAIAQQTSASGNTIHARWWTDGKMVAPMLPDRPAFVKCPACGRLFWLKDAKKIGERQGRRSWGKTEGREFALPTAAEYIKRAAIEKNKERQMDLRVRAWHLSNDPWRNKWGARPALSQQTTQNLKALSNLLAALYPEERIMRAEIARELGSFSQCIALLKNINEEQRDMGLTIRLLAEAKYATIAEVIPGDEPPDNEELPKEMTETAAWETDLFARALVADSAPCVKLLLIHHKLSDLLGKTTDEQRSLVRQACRTGASETLYAVAGKAIEEDSDTDLATLLGFGLDKDGGKTSEAPLITACWMGSEKTARLLVERRANLDAQDQFGRTPLMFAVVGLRTSMARMLIAKGAAVDAINGDGNTALMLICAGETYYMPMKMTGEEHRARTLEIMRLLTEGGADVNRLSLGADVFGEAKVTPLIQICLASSPKNLAPERKPVEDEVIPLAATKEDMVQALLDAKADVNKQDTGGRTALICACEVGNYAIVNLLINHGANVSLASKDGRTPLLAACEGSGDEIIRLLVEKGADVNAGNRWGITPLMICCGGRKAESAALLIRKGARVSAASKGGWTALHNAVSSAECARLLIAAGADLNARDEKGRTPLMYACEGYGEDGDKVIPLLVAAGTNVEIKDTAGRTAMALAKQSGLESHISALQKALSARKSGPGQGTSTH